MRKLSDCGVLRIMSLEVLSALSRWATNGPLFPNLGTLDLWTADAVFVPFIPLFLSPRTTAIRIQAFESGDPPIATFTSTIIIFPILCPNLQEIELPYMRRDPMIVTAVSRMLLTNNRDTIRRFHVDSPLTEEAREVIYRLPDLRGLSVVVEKAVSLPPLMFPNLTDLVITYDHDSDWSRMFRGATLGKLKCVRFLSGSEQIGDFLETFEKVALAASVQKTLSEFHFSTPFPWNPKYSSLLPFTQLTHLVIDLLCDDGCSSTEDDKIITDLAQAMPKLEVLALCEEPCDETSTGVTAKGLVALADHCLDLNTLRIHIQVASLSVPPASGGVTSNAGPTALQRDCGLTQLEVGSIPLPEESVLVVAMTLARIFPHIRYIDPTGNWEKVLDAIELSRQIVDRSSKERSLSTFQTSFDGISPGAASEDSD